MGIWTEFLTITRRSGNHFSSQLASPQQTEEPSPALRKAWLDATREYDRNLKRLPILLEGSVLRRLAKTSDLVATIESILASKNLTLYQISSQSRAIYGRSSPYFIPHNLFYDLRRGTFTPSIFQVAAFSRISGYRLEHWLRIFDIDPKKILDLQLLLPTKRTMLLDSSLSDRTSSVTWLKSRPDAKKDLTATFPLSQNLEVGPRRPIGAIQQSDNRFLYVKVGCEDAFAFPELLPGSVVRVVVAGAQDAATIDAAARSGRIFLVKHSRGLFCCRLDFCGRSVAVPLSNRLPYGQVELRFPDEAMILGIADAEIRCPLNAVRPTVPKQLAGSWRPEHLSQMWNLSALLRHLRSNMDLTLREASLLSRQIAEAQEDDRYFISASALSDYEATDQPPRHIQKSISLCTVYGLPFRSLLNLVGIEERSLGSVPMPANFVGVSESDHASRTRPSSESSGLLEALLQELQEVPFFLRQSLPTITKIPEISLNDFYWIGKQTASLHPCMANALLVIVNHRKKRTLYFRSKPLWQQPIYMLMKRDGTYLCACCSLENRDLIIHPYPSQSYRPWRLRNHKDAEVIGEVVAIMRALI